MRIAKIDELRKEIELYYQNFCRDLDNKDAILQMLDTDIDEAEEHFSIALNNHFTHIQELTSLQDSRIKALFKEFERDVSELENEFKTEFTQLRNNFEDEQNEINKMLRFIKIDTSEKERKLREDFKTIGDKVKTDIKDNNTKIQENIQKMADNEVNIFNSEMNDIKAKSKEKTALDNQYIKHLNELENAILRKKKKGEQLNEYKKQLATKVRQNEEDWKNKNAALKKEKDNIMESYKKLKAKMISFRNIQREKLKKLVKNSWDCNIKLNDYIKLSEKILKMAEICRRLETEREKILPYYENSDIGVNEVVLPDAEKLLGMDSKSYDEIESMKNFWKRYNKVLLDVIAIKKQKEEISVQNQILLSLLKKYYDGFTVNNVVMTSPGNPLLIIDGEKNLFNILEVKNQHLTVQEGTQINGEYIKQYEFAKI